MSASVYVEKQFTFEERGTIAFESPSKIIKVDMLPNVIVSGSAAPTTNNVAPKAEICGAGDDRKLLSPSSVNNTNFEQHCRLLEVENQNLKDSQSKLQQQSTDAQRRERILMRRLANKEQEFQDYVSQIAEYKAAQAPGPAALRSALLDPAVNLLFEKLKKELQATKAKLEETQNELSAWKFTPDSNTGKRLMAKCRLLYQENEELGKMTSNGRLAKLEGELAMQKNFSEEVKKSQSELDDFLQELDEDVEGMQSTILYLQQELKTTKDRIQYLEKENFQLKNGIFADDTDRSMHLTINGKDAVPPIAPEPTTTTTTSTTSENFVKSEERTTITNKNNSNFNVYNSSCDNTFLKNSNDNNSNISDNKISSHSINNNNKNKNNDIIEPPLITNGMIIDNSENKNENFGQCNIGENSSNNSKLNLKKRNYDSDSSESGSINDTTNTTITGSGVSSSTAQTKLRINKKLKIKKTRRGSILTVDINEDETQNAGQESDEDDGQTVVTRRKSARNHQNGE